MTKQASRGAAASGAPAPASTQTASATPEVAGAPPADLATDPVAVVKARVLVAGVYGSVDDLVEVSEAEAAASGDLDTHPDAVAYVERELKKEARRMAFREGHPEDPAA
jgi:hypothetical protein